VKTKYSEVPRDVLAFLSSFIDEIRNNFLDLSEWYDLHEYERAFTTPRTLEYLVSEYVSLGGHEARSQEEVKRVLKDLNMANVIRKDHLLEFCTYLENRARMMELLEKGEKKVTFQISALTYLGEALRRYSEAKNVEELKRMERDSVIVPYDKIKNYVSKLLDRKEMVNFLIFGSRVFEKGEHFSDSLRVAIFMIETLNGKSFEEARKSAEKFSARFTLKEIIIDPDRKIDKLQGVLDKVAETDVAKIVRDAVKNVSVSHLVRVTELMNDYYDKKFKESMELSETKKKLFRYMSKEELEELEKYIEEKAEEKLKEMQSRKKNKKTVNVIKPVK
jgi:hypothetical protein